MKDNWKPILKSIIPPILLDNMRFRSKYGWFGDYSSWEDAQKDSVGYDSELIFEKVKNSLLKVKNGEAVYERDSVLFDKIDYSWPLLASLLWIAAQKGNCLNIIDFGGSLGSTYFQNRKFLSAVRKLRWNIVEQDNFVNCGEKYFEDDMLKFYYDIGSCMKETNPSTILFSSSIQYTEKPYDLLANILKNKFEYIIFDLTGFISNGSRDRLTIQKVPPSIYEATYPCWFLNKEKFLSIFKNNYSLVEEFEGYLGQDIKIDNRIDAKYLGFIFETLVK
jgi:putative methyltransferase (TIGR04325 family)